MIELIIGFVAGVASCFASGWIASRFIPCVPSTETMIVLSSNLLAGSDVELRQLAKEYVRTVYGKAIPAAVATSLINAMSEISNGK